MIRQSWDGFKRAWSSLFETKVIRRINGGDVIDKNRVKEEMFRYFEWWRKWILIPASILVGAICMYLDSERERATMLKFEFPNLFCTSCRDIDVYKGRQTTFSGQVARACEDPDFQSRWLWEEFERRKIPAKNACHLVETQYTNMKNLPLEYIRHQQYFERVKNVEVLEFL